MDGYDATREIRRREKPGGHSLVIATTAEAMAGARERCQVRSIPFSTLRLGASTCLLGCANSPNRPELAAWWDVEPK